MVILIKKKCKKFLTGCHLFLEGHQLQEAPCIFDSVIGDDGLLKTVDFFPSFLDLTFSPKLESLSDSLPSCICFELLSG